MCVCIYIYPSNNDKYDLSVFLAVVKDDIKQYLLSRTTNTSGIKWSLCVNVEMNRDTNQGENEMDKKTKKRCFRDKVLL